MEVAPHGVKTNFYNIGGATSGGGATWCLDCNILLPVSEEVIVPNIKSLALLVSEIWTTQCFALDNLRSTHAKYYVPNFNNL